jgi:hypothetical protein
MGQCAIDRKRSTTLAVFGLVLLLAGCMFSPGKFVSALDLRRDGQFTYTYQGEIHVMALSDLAGKAEASQPFSASACHDYDEDGNERVRECNADELDAQKEDWKAQQDRANQKRKQDAEKFRGVIGGFDPTDPKAAEELAQRLRKQAGFRSVSYKGNGLYIVDFSITSRLTHDFAFPTVEHFAMANAFVQLSLRQGGVVRMDAPGFASAGGGNPMQAMLAGLGPAAAKVDGPKLPVLDGRFTLTTDGEIVANNTDEGAQTVAGGKSLTWTINNRTQAAPMALISLGQP